MNTYVTIALIALLMTTTPATGAAFHGDETLAEPYSTQQSSDFTPCYAVDWSKTPPSVYEVPCE